MFPTNPPSIPHEPTWFKEMSKFRSRSFFLEAVQFKPWEKPWPSNVIQVPNLHPAQYELVTLHGKYSVEPGDWLVTMMTNKRMVVEPALFAELFEPADGEVVNYEAPPPYSGLTEGC